MSKQQSYVYYDSDSSDSWNRNCFWLMSMVESESESFGIELELWWVEFWMGSEWLNGDGVWFRFHIYVALRLIQM